MIINSPWLKNLINKDYDSLSQLVKDLHIDSTLLNVNRYFSGTGKMNEYYSKIGDSLEQIASMTDEELENYLKDTTELTEMEKIQNYLSFTKDWLESKNSWFNLSNIAFGMYIASGFTKVIGGLGKFIGGWANGGGLAGGLSALLGVGTSGGAGAASSLAGMLGSAGPIGLAIAGVAVTAGAILAVNKMIAAKNNEGNTEYPNRVNSIYASNLANLRENGVTDIDKTSEYLKALNEAQSRGNIGIFEGASEVGLTKNADGSYSVNNGGHLYGMLEGFSYLDKGTRESVGLTPKGAVRGSEEAVRALEKYARNKEWEKYNNIKAFALRNVMNNNADLLKSSDLYAALNVAYFLNKMNRDSAITNPLSKYFEYDLKSSKSQISEILEKNGMTDASRLLEVYKILSHPDIDFYLATSGGNFHGFPTEEEINKVFFSSEGYHLAGKDYIPRDNYRALLHKGEMVLNAREAAFYRSMFPYGGESDKVPRPAGRIVTGLPWTMTAGYPSYPKGSQHRGVDFGIPIGTAVGAAMSGIVVDANNKVNYNTYGSGVRSFGEYVLIKGNNGLYYRYGHLSKLGVIPGQIVNAGDTIGLSGNTGYSTGPHLHFQVQTGTGNTTDISPYSYITAGLFQAKGDISIPGISTGVNSTTPGTEEGVKVSPSKRFIPTAFQHGGIGGGEDSATRISGSVNSGINRIIDYLENVRAEQKEQRELINAFSQTRMSDSNF